MYGNEDSEDLRNEIYQLKKQLLTTTTENNLLKVKLRKLLDEINRKDKQLDAIFDPKKSPDIRKIVCERNAAFVVNIKEKNDKLKKTISEKDAVIKRLQKQLEIVKLYSSSSTQFLDCDENAKRRFNLKVSNGKKPENLEIKRNRSLQTPESISKSNIADQYRGLSREHLLSIIENLKNPSRCGSNSRKSSPESDFDRIDSYCNSPHEEIQQLHRHFVEMITEVDYLKTTISQLQDEQHKSDHILKKKDDRIDKLAAEIRNMKKPKSRKKHSGYTTTVAFNSDDFSRQFNRNFGKSNKITTTKVTKDVMTQIEDYDSVDLPNFRNYIDNGSIVIVKKPQATQTVGNLNSNDKEGEQIPEEIDNEQKV